MKLAYFKSTPTNFGDELNAYMWNKLLPEGFLDENEDELFVGIGSILGEIFPSASMKHVFGAGMGGYSDPPDMASGRWNIVFVRGPLTAQALDLPADLAICDSALLLREIEDLPPPAPGIGIAFMPHFESLPRGDWKRVCRLAGILLIDPTDPPSTVISQIRGARLLITEAMHGAIVADALRTPWIAALPIHASHHAKWSDWAGALKLKVNSHRLLPSAIRELVTFVTGYGAGRLRNHHWPDAWYMAPFAAAIAHVSARRLRRIAASATPQLSDENEIRAVTLKARQALDAFVAQYTVNTESGVIRPQQAGPGVEPHLLHQTQRAPG